MLFNRYCRFIPVSHCVLEQPEQGARKLVAECLGAVKYLVRVDVLQNKIQQVAKVYAEAAAAGDPLRVSVLDGPLC